MQRTKLASPCYRSLENAVQESGANSESEQGGLDEESASASAKIATETLSLGLSPMTCVDQANAP